MQFLRFRLLYGQWCSVRKADFPRGSFVAWGLYTTANGISGLFKVGAGKREGVGERLVLRGVRWGMGLYCATVAKTGVLSRFEFIRYCLQGKAAAIRAARGAGLLLVTIGLIAMRIYA